MLYVCDVYVEIVRSVLRWCTAVLTVMMMVLIFFSAAWLQNSFVQNSIEDSNSEVTLFAVWCKNYVSDVLTSWIGMFCVYQDGEREAGNHFSVTDSSTTECRCRRRQRAKHGRRKARKGLFHS